MQETVQKLDYANADKIEEIRATDIIWDVDSEEERDFLPTTVRIPEDYAFDPELGEETLTDTVSDWLSDEYSFCNKGFKIIYLTGKDLKTEEENLQRSIFDAGVNAIEDFLGHPLDSENIDIESEMEDCIAGMPDAVYFEYLGKYCIS